MVSCLYDSQKMLDTVLRKAAIRQGGWGYMATGLQKVCGANGCRFGTDVVYKLANHSLAPIKSRETLAWIARCLPEKTSAAGAIYIIILKYIFEMAHYLIVQCLIRIFYPDFPYNYFTPSVHKKILRKCKIIYIIPEQMCQKRPICSCIIRIIKLYA